LLQKQPSTSKIGPPKAIAVATPAIFPYPLYLPMTLIMLEKKTPDSELLPSNSKRNISLI
jgi:hypothetical protein